jgi:hypothetical protein
VTGGLAVVAIELAVLVELLHRDDLQRGALISMVAGLQPFVGTAWTIDVLLITAGMVLLGLITLCLFRWSPRPELWTLGLAITLLAVGGIAAHRAFAPRLNSGARASEIAAVEDLIGDQQPIWVVFIPDEFGPALPQGAQLTRSLLYQWYLGDHEFRLLPAGHVAPGSVVISVVNDGRLRQAGGTRIWEDPRRDMAVWRVDAPVADEESDSDPPSTVPQGFGKSGR